jgi:FtsP/CotA-like multicopper oxidase with cupredoxin domain
MWNKLRHRYLALIGIIVIAGGLYFALADISREPTDLPPPIGKRDPQTVRVDLLAAEVEGRLAEGTTFGYWTFNGNVPKPLEGIQTVSVAPGGAVIVEFKLQVPGNYTIVDHALTRLERGLAGILTVEGPPNPDIYNGQVMPGMDH